MGEYFTMTYVGTDDITYGRRKDFKYLKQTFTQNVIAKTYIKYCTYQYYFNALNYLLRITILYITSFVLSLCL